MSTLKEKYHVKEMAEFLKVSRSAFYRWQSRGESTKEREDSALKVRILELFINSKQTYGAVRIAKGMTRA